MDITSDFSNEDTIAAIATPVGRGGIGIIRISGPLAIGIAENIFRPKHPVRPLQSHHLYLGQICDPTTSATLDQVLLSCMRAPYSYTCEDVVEINSHSGYLLLSKILQVVLDQGAKLAQPGEFTFRAYINGRIDLTQAEAVIQLIDSQSETGLHLASQQVQGAFKQQILALRQGLIDTLAQVEVSIDYPEEETEITPIAELVHRISEQIHAPVLDLIAAHAGKKIWIDGVNTVIAGRVNVGKSSLLNRLSNEEKAIVTSVPGTTRDVIASPTSIDGIPFHLMDTAGFVNATDPVEKIGIEKAIQKFDAADLLLIVLDQNRSLTQIDLDTIAKAKGKSAIIVINKIDLPAVLLEVPHSHGFPVVRISALIGQGLNDLKQAMKQAVLQGETDLAATSIAPNLRHQQALKHAAASLENAMQALRKGMPMEIVAEELKQALDALGEIIGATAHEEILNSVFSQFCLGK